MKFEEYLLNAQNYDENYVMSKTGFKMIYLERCDPQESLIEKLAQLKNVKLMRWNDKSKRLFCEIFIHYMIFTNTSYKTFNFQESSGFMTEEFMEQFGKVIGMEKNQCIKLWLALYEPFQKNGERKQWEQDEETLIRKLAQLQRPDDLVIDEKLIDWNLMALNFNVLNRNPSFTSAKQLKEHFSNSMRPDITKEEFSLHEDFMLIREILKQGRKWNSIAQVLQNRQCNQVKNRYFQILKKIEPIKKIKSFSKIQERQLCLQIYETMKEGLNLEDEKLEFSSEFRTEHNSSTQEDHGNESNQISENEEKVKTEEVQQRAGEVFELHEYDPIFQSSSKSYSSIEFEENNQHHFIDELLNSYALDDNQALLY